MEKKLKDFLHLYLGCECKMTKPSYHAVHELHLSADTAFVLTGKLLHYFIEPTTKAEVKPILRKLSSINSEESSTKDEICSGVIDVYKAAKLTDYLRSKGFWLGSNDWFDEGLIIDADTIKQ